jgi:hypothetical protein
VNTTARQPGRQSTLRLVAVVTTLCGGVASGGELPVRLTLQQPGDLPFSSEQLVTAVEARLPVVRAADAVAAPVRVQPAGTLGAVVVETAAGRLEVAVGGRQPTEAARLVALAIVDVTRPPPSAAVVTKAKAALAGPGAGSAALFGVALVPGLSVGLNGRAASLEPTADLVLGLRHRGDTTAPATTWGLGLSLGFARATAPWRDHELALSTFPARLGPRVRWHQLELGAGAAARMYGTTGLDGGWGTLLGGFATVGISGALAGGVRWTALAACDVYREKVVFRAAGDPVMTAGPFIFWLGVGARWQGGAS